MTRCAWCNHVTVSHRGVCWRPTCKDAIAEVQAAEARRRAAFRTQTTRGGTITPGRRPLPKRKITKAEGEGYR